MFKKYFAFIGCATVICFSHASAIVARDDLSGLGNSKLAARLKNSIFISQQTVEQSVNRFVNSPEILSRQNKADGLSEVGFTCNSTVPDECYYEGTAITTIERINEPGTTQIKVNLTLKAKIFPERIVVSSTLTRSENRKE